MKQIKQIKQIKQKQIKVEGSQSCQNALVFETLNFINDDEEALVEISSILRILRILSNETHVKDDVSNANNTNNATSVQYANLLETNNTEQEVVCDDAALCKSCRSVSQGRILLALDGNTVKCHPRLLKLRHFTTSEVLIDFIDLFTYSTRVLCAGDLTRITTVVFLYNHINNNTSLRTGGKQKQLKLLYTLVDKNTKAIDNPTLRRLQLSNLTPVQLIQLDMLRMELKDNFLERPLYLNYCENVTNLIADHVLHNTRYEIAESISNMINEIKTGQLSPSTVDISPLFPIQGHMAIRMHLTLTAISYNLTLQERDLTDFFLRVLFICALKTGRDAWVKLSRMLTSYENYFELSCALREATV